MIEIFSLAGGKYTLDQIEVEDFRDSEEERRSETYSELSEPEVRSQSDNLVRLTGGCCVMSWPTLTVRVSFLWSDPGFMLSPLLCEHLGN